MEMGVKEKAMKQCEISIDRVDKSWNEFASVNRMYFRRYVAKKQRHLTKRPFQMADA